MSDKLFKKLWNMANDIRVSSMDINEFQDYVLVIMFYKFISDKNEKYYIEELNKNLDDKNRTLKENMQIPGYEEGLKKEAKRVLGYALSYSSLFSTILNDVKNKTYQNKQLIDAIQDFNDNLQQKEQFEGIFDNLDLNNNNLGKTSADKNNVISKLILNLDEISQSQALDSDLLGDAYEYLIFKFASSAGKKAGEFYTPQSLSKLMSKIIISQNKNIKNIYDPTCGSGSLLLRLYKELENNNIVINSINGQEIMNKTYNLARMNMCIHNIDMDAFHIKLGDTIKEPNEILKQKKYDAIVSNPPYGVKWDGGDEKLLQDPRFYTYGVLAPKGSMESAFIQHIDHYLSEKGVATILLPTGILFRTGAENKILSKLIDDNHLDAVILLPSNMFRSTGIPVICMVIKKCKQNNDVLLIDASDLYQKVGKNNELNNNNIDEILNLYIKREDSDISKKLDIDTIKQNKYNLNITRYIQRVKEKEIDIDTLGLEIKNNLQKLKTLEENIVEDIKKIKDLL